jgi:hypothetical protein
MGGTVPDCDGVEAAQATSPGALDEAHTLTSTSGPATVSVSVVSSPCTVAQNRVDLDTDVTVP